MRQRSDLRLSPECGEFRQFMNADEYRAFCDKMAEQIQPELDTQAEARARSEASARKHYVH